MDSLAAFHTQSLSFPLNDLSTLASAQLALVQFHPDADSALVERARIEWMRRRLGWMEGERAHAERNEGGEDAVKEEETDGVKQEEAEAKREVEEISLLDSDDDGSGSDVELVVKKEGQVKREGKAQPSMQRKKKRKSGEADASSSSSSAARPAKAKRTPSGGTASTSRAVLPPPPPPPASAAAPAGPNKLLKLPSFRRNASSSTPPVPPMPPSDDEPLPFSLPGLAPARPPPPPAPVVRRADQPPPPDLLYRRRSPSPAAEGTRAAEPEPLVFVPNYGAKRDRGEGGLPDYVVDSFPDRDPNVPFVYRAPPPDPTFTPLPAHADEDGEAVAPVELRKQLITVRVAGLASHISWELLFRFLVRGRKLKPRPLAVRRLEETETVEYWPEPEDWQGTEGDARTWLLAFRTLQDAQAVVDYNQGKQLPDFDNYPRTIDASFVSPAYEALSAAAVAAAAAAAPPPPTASTAGATASEAASAPKPPPTALLTPAELFALRQKADEEELAVEWKWGEMSDETRRDWRAYFRLPTSRRCPPHDFIDEENGGCAIGEEYDAERQRLEYVSMVGGKLLAVPLAEKRAMYAEAKKQIYLERREAWNAWADRVDPADAATDPSKPELPTYPLDEVAEPRVEAKEKALEAKREEERKVADKRLIDAFRALAEQSKRYEEERKEREARMDASFERTLALFSAAVDRVGERSLAGPRAAETPTSTIAVHHPAAGSSAKAPDPAAPPATSPKSSASTAHASSAVPLGPLKRAGTTAVPPRPVDSQPPSISVAMPSSASPSLSSTAPAPPATSAREKPAQLDARKRELAAKELSAFGFAIKAKGPPAVSTSAASAAPTSAPPPAPRKVSSSSTLAVSVGAPPTPVWGSSSSTTAASAAIPSPPTPAVAPVTPPARNRASSPRSTLNIAKRRREE
ncbi:hypothetical protein JCM10213_006564 [Rhodosporidiobolus nylandii]